MTSHLQHTKKDWKILTIILILLVSTIASEPYFYKWLISSIENKQ